MGRFPLLFLSGLLYLFGLIGDITFAIIKLLYKLIAYIIRLHSTTVIDLVRGIGSVSITIAYSLLRLIQSVYHGLLRIVETLFRFRPPRLFKHTHQRVPEKRAFFVTTTIKAFTLGFILATIGITVPAGIYLLSQDLPNPHILSIRDIPVTTKLYDRNGRLLYEIYAEENRTPVPFEEIPHYFKQATLAIEDQDFYQHHGFSPQGIIRAAYAILVKDELQGGSTITQQLVRSALLTQEVSVQRKLKELALSIWTEQLYTKDKILEMYFTQVPYGGTAWGAEAAAQTYFGKSIRDVTLAEAAYLAGLPAAPTYFSPYGSHPEFARQRQQEVLRRMTEDGYITDEERSTAESESIVFRTPRISIAAPHFVMYVKGLLSKQYGIRMVEQGGLRVTTSLDIDLQNEIQSIVTQEVEKLKSLSVGNGAVVVTDPKTGHILAMVGSTDYFDIAREGNVNVALTPQQPGSTIKAVTYTTALQNGFTAASLINDSPITYSVPGTNPYSPVNYDGRFHGLVPLRYALGNSYNVPAVRTLAKIGVQTMIAQGKAMGIDSWSEDRGFGLSLTLGGGEVTMLDMAAVYGTLATGGIHRQVSPILEVTDYLGNTLENNREAAGTPVVPEEVAFIISDILADNTARSAAFGPSSTLTIPGAWVAVKTGTSNDKRDNWAIGYTKDFVVTTWVGNNDNTPMHPTLTSGITGATPIWRGVTDRMLTRYPSKQPSPPANVVRVACRGRDEYFIDGTQPLRDCPAIPKLDPSPPQSLKRQTKKFAQHTFIVSYRLISSTSLVMNTTLLGQSVMLLG